MGEQGAWRVSAPSLEPVDTRGAGDSYAAGLAAVLADGGSHADAIRTGAAAGAVNATRRGLGTGDAEAVRAIAERVEARAARLTRPARHDGGRRLAAPPSVDGCCYGASAATTSDECSTYSWSRVSFVSHSAMIVSTAAPAR
ncbi:PfkB family carbohydrate kinase [Agrococcus sp. SL85]|uniref:PfkB family carbohydrate kinase n=1 Tax=Agrococcus sp. SL85 TaxID=2995141 RepID=UPI003B632557